MILYDGEVSIRGIDYDILDEFSEIAKTVAENIGADVTLEAAVKGVYGDSPEQMALIHRKFLERGMNV